MPLVLTIIAALPQIATGVEHLIAFVRAHRSAALQTGEWTAAEETAFLNALLARGATSAYKPDAP